MSANNELLITETPTHFEISDIDIETKEGYIVGKSKDLRRAIKMAREYQENYEVEYGIDFDLIK